MSLRQLNVNYRCFHVLNSPSVLFKSLNARSRKDSVAPNVCLFLRNISSANTCILTSAQVLRTALSS